MINRNKKTTETNEDSDFQLGPSTAQIFEDVDHENTPKPNETDERYDALAKQLSDMQIRLVEAERANMALISQPQGNASQVTFVEQDPNKISLPDPALDPEGYERAFTQRQQIRSDNERRRNEFTTKQQTEISEKVDDLWNSFSDKYADMAEDKERIDFIASKLVKQAVKRGVDANRYMFVTQDKFINDVAAEYVKIFGDPSDNNENDNDSNQSRRRNASDNNSRRNSSSRNREEDYDVGRTGGVFGGNESGGRPTKRGGREEDTGSMIDDIQTLQRKTGFFTWAIIATGVLIAYGSSAVSLFA